ncbi:hypothetical protein CPT_Mendera_284 [Stenotrophomonas phage Mendera]|uniref:Uncharacterized protein n=2 Tax=Menderavirus TaxID=2843421 RepID=A0A482ID84_9CAUD|nr:hypothetical protein HWC11_gp243 [Stenotrophomonas phage YB07]YP_009851318.1 hypothetical protein HWC60_gp131 [Stenotrophomonas phage Mendera]QXN67353.1 hypothetical protein [Stenotrophomonas phage BUCT608]QYW02792.1 hypothetical protein CPT_Marzo_274 [Stenotrophomonas phage Marzo]QBP06439.1 hypothetical protein [Stenotrophomonas phage YB07]QFR56810.1 hypothetical protein CPT_Mendera_284 [Stenotrophomonas phage Mendera]QYC97491.1 hypothetical protein [Stenotrophomonas phage BUCT608]
MRRLESYSDPIETAGKRLRALIESDERIVAFAKEPDGVFIYTNSSEWVCDGTLSGTFRGDNVTDAIRWYKQNVVARPPGCTHCKDRGWYWSMSLAPYRIQCSCQPDEDESIIGK